MIASLVSFVVQEPTFFLQIKLDPVVKTDKFTSRLRLANKDMLKSTGVQAGEKDNHNHKTQSLMIFRPLYTSCIRPSLSLTQSFSVDDKGETRCGWVDSWIASHLSWTAFCSLSTDGPAGDKNIYNKNLGIPTQDKTFKDDWTFSLH